MNLDDKKILAEWKVVEKYPSYEISSFGVLRRKWKSGMLYLSLIPNIDGYPKSHISYKGKVYNVLIHRLVLEAFYGPCPNGMESRHLDGNPANCYKKNLMWDTHKNNMADKIKHKTLLFGEKANNVKLNTMGVTIIKKRLRAGFSLAELGRIFKVSESTIGSIKRGRTWRSVAHARGN